MTLLQSTGYKASLNGLMSVKLMWIICCGLRSHQISTQLYIYGRVWTDMLDSAFCHHLHNTKWGNTFGRRVFFPSVEFQRLLESIPRRIEAVLAAHGGYLETLCCFFLYMLLVYMSLSRVFITVFMSQTQTFSTMELRRGESQTYCRTRKLCHISNSDHL